VPVLGVAGHERHLVIDWKGDPMRSCRSSGSGNSGKPDDARSPPREGAPHGGISDAVLRSLLEGPADAWATPRDEQAGGGQRLEPDALLTPARCASPLACSNTALACRGPRVTIHVTLDDARTASSSTAPEMRQSWTKSRVLPSTRSGAGYSCRVSASRMAAARRTSNHLLGGRSCCRTTSRQRRSERRC
jgi:hypothetical protein